MRELQHITATRLVWPIKSIQLAQAIYSESSFGVNVAFLLFTNSSSSNDLALFCSTTPRRQRASLARRKDQKDRGGKTPIESKPGLCGSITGDFGDSLSVHFPPLDFTSMTPIEPGEPNSAA
jgi:hypothetical protein